MLIRKTNTKVNERGAAPQKGNCMSKEKKEKIAEGFMYVTDGYSSSIQIMQTFDELKKQLDEIQNKYSTYLGEDGMKRLSDVSAQLPAMIHKVSAASQGFEQWIDDLQKDRTIPSYKTIFVDKSLITKKTDDYITLRIPDGIAHEGMYIRLRNNQSFIKELDDKEKKIFQYRYYPDDKYQLSLFKYDKDNNLTKINLSKERFADLMIAANKVVSIQEKEKAKEPDIDDSQENYLELDKASRRKER